MKRVPSVGQRALNSSFGAVESSEAAADASKLEITINDPDPDVEPWWEETTKADDKNDVDDIVDNEIEDENEDNDEESEDDDDDEIDANDMNNFKNDDQDEALEDDAEFNEIVSGALNLMSKSSRDLYKKKMRVCLI